MGGVGMRCTWGWDARMWGGIDGCDCMCPLKLSNGVMSAYSHSFMKYDS